jgi:group I intron endonuclease
MFFTIYKTTNTQNGKFYIGKHQTENLSDGYLGSGSAIKEAIKKYGKNSFDKEILFIFETEAEMNQKEKEILTEEFISDRNNYNRGVGGEGGPHFKGKKHTSEVKERIAQKITGRKLSDEAKRKIAQSNSRRSVSEETRKKLSEKAKNLSLEERKKRSEAIKNSMTQETKKKISEKAKIREANKRILRSREVVIPLGS